MATPDDLYCRFRLSIGDSFNILFDNIKAPKYALVWFCFNDGYEMTWEVELPLKPLYYFNEQRPMGQTNKRGLYVAPRFEQVSTMFRLKAVGVNQTEFVYEESRNSLRAHVGGWQSRDLSGGLPFSKRTL